MRVAPDMCSEDRVIGKERSATLAAGRPPGSFRGPSTFATECLDPRRAGSADRRADFWSGYPRSETVGNAISLQCVR